MRSRLLRLPIRLLALVGAAIVAAGCLGGAIPDRGGEPAASVRPTPVPTRRPTPRPAPGYELYGFVPYWEMDDTIATHVAAAPLTTLALFSVTNTASGAINPNAPGYQRIVGDIGRTLAADAHARGVRVELTWTSFGTERNADFLGNRERQDATIASLVALVGELGLDGVNADMEGLDPGLVGAYGAFLERLRAALVAADPDDQLSVATGAGALGAALAAAATDAGVDRIFVMAYDYRTSGSDPGATAPLERADGGLTIPATLDAYEALGVPLERTLLGLPLYGYTWPVAGPAVGAPRIGRGAAWIPRRNLELFDDPAAVPVRDPLEAVDVYFVADDGTYVPPSISPDGEGTPDGEPAEERRWSAVYVDAPDTFARKLALANERGLAGAGVWALGYTRGLPAWTEVLVQFADDRTGT